MRDQADPDAIRAAEEAIEPGRLLPGEDPESLLLDDSQHWAAVYTELLMTKTRILDATLEQMEAATHPAVQDELQSDQTVLVTEIERFQRRLRYWHDREVELRGRRA